MRRLGLQMLRNHTPKGLRATELVAVAICAVTALSQATKADTVYRCAEAYSTSSQCANGAATEVRPTSALHTTGSDAGHTATRDLRDAQALEKQRLQAERQATSAAPARLTPMATTASTPSAGVLPDYPPSKRKGKHIRNPNSPYFTAVDPNAAPKKRSTAKAVPATSASSP